MFGFTTTYIVEFDIAAIILTLMLIYTIFMRRSFPTPAIRQYKILLIFILISSVSDLISAYTLCNVENFSMPLNYVLNITYILSHNLTGVFFMIYIIAAIRGNLGRIYEKIIWISLISFISIFVLTTPLTNFVFYFNENNEYCHGVLFPVLYVFSACTILYAVVLILTHRSIMSTFQMATNFGFLILIGISVAYQAIHSDCLIENFIAATACLMMNVALDNPATYFYQSTSCYNQSAFDITIEKKLASKSEFTLVAFTFDDLSIFRKQYTEKDYDNLIYKTIRRCQKIGSSKKIFILQDSTFVFLQEKGNTEKLVKLIEEAVTRPLKLYSGGVAAVVPHFCILKFPGEAKTVNDVNLVIYDMLNTIYRKTGQHIMFDTAELLSGLRREDEVIHVLRSAIRNDGIKVLYQPILNVKTGKFDCAEALVRLRDNTINTYPDEFIPIAEQNGLILDIGENVFDQVCRFLQESKCEEFGIRQINVNLSMVQILRRSAVENLVRIAKNRGVAPKNIVFELTETSNGEVDFKSLMNNVQYLKSVGFSLSLDDYGSGYSNITNVIKLPYDQIKIDKEILWAAINNNDSKQVLESIVKLVHSFGRTCVVEGIENAEMEQMLENFNIEFYQGYKYSKPVSAISLLAYIKENNQ